MTKPLTGKEKGLVGYWTFDDATANDLTANQTHGTLKTGDPNARRRQMWNPYDFGCLLTVDSKRVRARKLYLSGIPPQREVIQWVKEGKIRTIVNCLMPFEVQRLQRYRWTKGEGYQIFHYTGILICKMRTL